MIYSFRNRRYLIQATIPLARKLANLLGLIKDIESNTNDESRDLIKNVLNEIELKTSMCGGSSLSMHANYLLKKLNNKNSNIKLKEVESLLEQLDMQHYHASLIYSKFESEKKHLTWYKLTPNLNIDDNIAEQLNLLKGLIDVNSLKKSLSSNKSIESIVKILFDITKNREIKIYEKTFILFLIDRLLVLKNKLIENDGNNYSHVLVDSLHYFLSQKNYNNIDSRAWSSLLWHAHSLPNDFTNSLGFSNKEDYLSIFEKKEIINEVSVDVIPYIGNVSWPSWKALEGDFISLSDLLESKEISWDKVKNNLDDIISQSLKNDMNWNPGVFLKRLTEYIETHPEDQQNLSVILVQKLALWKDALLKRDPLSVLDWIDLALKSQDDWSVWFKDSIHVDNKVEQEIIYAIQEDLINNKELAIENIKALGLDWFLDTILTNNISGDCLDLKNGLINESLFWVYENKEVSLFFSELASNINEDNCGLISLVENHEKIKETIALTFDNNKKLEVSEKVKVIDDEISDELYLAIISDASDMCQLLQGSLIKANSEKFINEDFIRSIHSFKTLALNFNNEYVATFFGKIEVWSMRMFELNTSLTKKDFEFLFSLTTVALIVADSWKRKVNVVSLPELSYIESTLVTTEVKVDNKSVRIYSELYPDEHQLDHEYDLIDEAIFNNFQEEALDIFNQLDNLLVSNVKDNVDTINRLLHTLKGGARISGMLKLGMWVHQIEDVTTKKEAFLNETKLQEVLQYSFDKARNIFFNSVTEFKYNNSMEAKKDIVLKIPLHKIEDISDSLLTSEAAQKKSELSYDLLKKLLDNVKEPIKRLNFLASEIYLEAEGLLNSGGKTKRKQKSMFDELEMDTFTYFHELTRKLEEAISDNVLYNDLLETHIYELSDSSTSSKLWLNIAQKNLVNILNNEVKNYESRLKATVRSSCLELGKVAEIKFEGSSLSVNKKILDEVTPVLEHLVRNSVSHSLEMPENRGSKDKTAQINIVAGSNVDWFYFSVSDDGAGINLENVRKKAIEKKLMSENQIVTNDELCKFFFTPGFSTASVLSNVSGRGVGLDAVQDMLSNIGGYVDVVLTDVNKAKFIVYVPMTDWLLSGVKVMVNKKTYIISDSQIESISILPVVDIDIALTNRYIELDGVKRDVIYMDYINTLFDFHRLNNFYPVIHIKNGKSIIVDSVEFVEKQSIKTLPNKLYSDKGISGTTILSDSNIGIVIDVLSNKWNYLYQEVGVVNKVERVKNNNLVLVVDDSLTVRKATTKFLVKMGYDVATAENGLESIKYLEKEIIPGIILMDIEMPIMDGFEALQRIKSVDYLKDIPVVIISSRAVDKHINYAKSIGALDFLGKPFNEDKLFKILEQNLKLKESV